jgi:hypothetical protein
MFDGVAIGGFRQARTKLAVDVRQICANVAVR